MTYEEWEQQVPDSMRTDPLWRVTAYRLALFLSDLAWYDATKLLKDRRTNSLSDQLVRAVGSIHANISEGYSRSSGKEQARFYEYSLGSAREARGFYYQGRRVLCSKVFDHRLALLSDIARLVLTMVPERRAAERLTRFGSRRTSGDGPLVTDDELRIT